MIDLFQLDRGLLAALSSGATLAGVAAWFARVARRAGPADTATLRTRHEVLLRQLQELDTSGSKRPPEEVARERAAIERIAADLRGQIERAASAAGEPTPGPHGQGTVPVVRTRSRVRWLWAGAAVFGLGLYVMARGAWRRDEPLPLPGPGQLASVSPAHPATTANAPTDPAEAAARAALAKNPDDMEARLELARLSLDKEDYMAVWAETKRVLQASPGNPRALTYQSQVRLAMNQADVALDLLEQALARDPDLIQAHIYEGYVYLRMGRGQEASEVLTRAKRRFPAQAEMLERGFADMRAAVGKVEPFVAGAEPNPHALGVKNQAGARSAPVAFNPHAAATGAEPGATGSAVAGTLELEPRWRAAVPPGSVVFVTARQAGSAAGPPIAAKRLAPASFPLSFELSDADSMAGKPLPKHLSIEARVDRDGDAATRDPADPVARQDDVPAGTRQLRLVLAPKRP